MTQLPAQAAHIFYEGFTAEMKTDLATGIIHGRVINADEVLAFEGRTLLEFRRAFANKVSHHRARHTGGVAERR